MKVFIDYGQGVKDYTNYVVEDSLVYEDAINTPIIANFTLAASNSVFVVPKRSSYVWIVSERYNRNGGYLLPGQDPFTLGKVLVTGFITQEPERAFLGLNGKLPYPTTHFQQFTYAVNVTSDEWFLNTEFVPFIPAFVNQTQGQILSSIAKALRPDFFDVSSFVASGDLIPYYQYNPEQNWSDIAKQFADSSRYRVQIVNRVLYFQPFGTGSLGISYNEATQKQSQFSPLDLTTSVVSVPPVNDALVLGDEEPQNLWDNIFVGDGFTSNFQLLYSSFHGSTVTLQNDDWTENQFDTSQWNVQDPNNVFVLQGALNVIQTGNTSPSLGQTYIVGNNGVEIGGAINAQAGEFQFNDASTGILGGLYTSSALQQADCFAGFQISNSGSIVVTASGAGGIIIQPLLNGIAVGPQVITQPNHHYQLQIWIGGNRWDRYNSIYRDLSGQTQFGGNDLAGFGQVTFVVGDIDQALVIANAYGPQSVGAPVPIVPVLTKYTVDNITMPSFGIYGLINGLDLNLTLNYTTIALPPQGTLNVIALTGASGGLLPVLPQNLGPTVNYLLGTGFQNQTATIAQSGDTDELSFYNDTIPGVGSRIRFRSWQSGIAMARVNNPVAIAVEGAISGDNGVRSAIFANLTPSPRTSDECELAAAAAITDRSFPQFQGTYDVFTIPFYWETMFDPKVNDYPRTGRYLFINAPVRAVSGQNFFVNKVTVNVVEFRQEVLQITLAYGPDLYLEKQLQNFVERTDNLLTSQETKKAPTPVQLQNAGSFFLQPFQNVLPPVITNTVSGSFVQVDLGVAPVTACEVRRVDAGWGTNDQNLIGIFTTQQFTLPRTSRDRTWYLRPKNGAQTSRFSYTLRIAAPLTPSPPAFVSLSSNNLTLDYAGDVRDIYGVEIRVPVLAGASGNAGNTLPVSEIVRLAATSGSSQLSGRPAPGQEDMLDWMTFTDAANTHFFNSSNPIYTYLSGNKLWWLKGAGGHPWDLQLFDSTYVYLWITENGDENAWSNPTAYKRYDINDGNPTPQGVPMCPRFFTPGTTITIDTPAPTIIHRTLACESDGEAPFSIGNIRMVTTGPTSMAWGGDVGTQQTILVTYYYGSSFGSRERFFLVKNVGLVQWDVAAGTFGGSYTVSQTSQYITRTSGGSPVPYFPCQTGASWWIPDIASGVASPFNVLAIYGNGFTDVVTTPLVQAGDVVLVSIPANQGFSGLKVVTKSILNTDGTGGAFWFDVNQPYAMSVGGYFGPGGVGTIQLYSRGLSAPMATVAVAGATTTVTTSGPHFFSAGNTVIIGCNAFPPYPGGQLSVLLNTVHDSFPGNGAFPISSVGTNTFTYPTPLAMIGGPFDGQTINVEGYAAMLSAGNTSITLYQRPVFSPSDLSFDLTEPGVHNALLLIESLSTTRRISSIEAYFFNLTWDYSVPLALGTLVGVPSISGLAIDPNTHQTNWLVTTGKPTGYRVNLQDPTSGITYDRFTVDNPDNPQGLTQFRLADSDYFSDRIITVTPYDGLGDGIPIQISHSVVGSVLTPTITGQSSSSFYSVGVTYDGIPPPGTVLIRHPFDQPVIYGQDMIPSLGVVDLAPTADTVFTVSKNGVNFGTITARAGQSQGATLVFSAPPMAFAYKDILRVTTQTPSDLTAGDIGLTLTAVKVYTAGGGFVIGASGGIGPFQPNPGSQGGQFAQINQFLGDTLSMADNFVFANATNPAISRTLSDNIAAVGWADSITTNFFLPLTKTLTDNMAQVGWKDALLTNAPTVLQRKFVDNVTSGGSSGLFAYVSAIKKNTTLVIATAIIGSSTATVTGITDDNGNTWVSAGARATRTTGSLSATEIWYTTSNNIGGNPLITINLSGSVTNCQMWAYEVGGEHVLQDAETINDGTTTTTAVGPSVTGSGGLGNFFLTVIASASGGTISAVNSNWTLDNSGVTAHGGMAAYIPKVISGSPNGTSPQQATFTISSTSTFCMSAVSFK